MKTALKTAILVLLTINAYLIWSLSWYLLAIITFAVVFTLLLIIIGRTFRKEAIHAK
ncbi:hypothetical protein [Mucilaginibacter gynuensis]|uniref:hypothetical protein n=1 Tax=Mucilaginibacter gynuensis TaxID=1302236 RepID=UPI0031E8F175